MTLKLKRTPGLFLVGFMGAGKSTVGAALANELGWNFSDIDREIEAREGQKIKQIFADRGESVFRDLEAGAIRAQVARIESGRPCVVAVGGGAFVEERNWELIANNGVALWLDCTLDTVRRRLEGDETRPLATNREGLSQLLETRLPLYSRADYRVEANCDDVSEIVRRILSLPLF